MIDDLAVASDILIDRGFYEASQLLRSQSKILYTYYTEWGDDYGSLVECPCYVYGNPGITSIRELHKEYEKWRKELYKSISGKPHEKFAKLREILRPVYTINDFDQYFSTWLHKFYGFERLEATPI